MAYTISSSGTNRRVLGFQYSMKYPLGIMVLLLVFAQVTHPTKWMPPAR